MSEMDHPTPAPPANRAEGTNRLAVTTVAVSIIILILGLVTVAVLINQGVAVDALKKSSVRAECRTRIVNDAEDTNRHDTAALIKAAVEQRRADVQRLATKLEAAPRVQSVIDASCPKPLAGGGESTTTTTNPCDQFASGIQLPHDPRPGADACARATSTTVP